jgi:hypothetical protein
MFRNLFDRLTQLTRRSRMVGEQSIAEYQRRSEALRSAASSHSVTPDDRA